MSCATTGQASASSAPTAAFQHSDLTMPAKAAAAATAAHAARQAHAISATAIMPRCTHCKDKWLLGKGRRQGAASLPA